MNKKNFTLLVASLMLLVSAFAANAQGRGVGEKVDALPDGIAKAAYHLKVTALGHSRPVSVTGQDTVLALSGDGHVFLADSTYLFNVGGTDPDSTYLKLREALWCVTIDKIVSGKGVRPTFTFKNKEYDVPLSFTYDSSLKEADAKKAFFTVKGTDEGYATNNTSVAKMPNPTNTYVVGGNNEKWFFSDYHNTGVLDTSFLAIDLAPAETDYVATLAWTWNSTSPDGVIQLVKVHADSLLPGTSFYEDHLIFFELYTAAPRILSDKDFNSKLGTQASSTGKVQLTFTPDRSNTAIPNPFTDNNAKLTATKASVTGLANAGYLTLKNDQGEIISVKDPGDDGAGYANSNGKKYLQLKAGDSPDKPDMDKFRLVYYPSEDSLIINAYTVRHKVNEPHHTAEYITDPLTYDLDGLYNEEIYDALIVRAQTLDAKENKVIITVDNRPSNVRVSFGAGDCVTADDNRTTVNTDLYTIKDSRGYYLTVPLHAGDFTPQWVRLDEEVPLKTPAFQWLVVRINSDNGKSKVHIVNREFEEVQINYVQLYKEAKKFAGSYIYGTQSEYAAELAEALVSASGFVRVDDDPASLALYKELVKNKEEVPGYVWEKLYRTSPYLGYKYIASDTLNYYSYSFNHLHGYDNNRYLGFPEKPFPGVADTTMATVQGSQFFELLLPDALAKDDEKYGIGYVDTLVVNTKAILASLKEADKIALLQRRYYSLRVNDINIWNYSRNENVICLDRNKRYGYTSKENAESRPLAISKFYLRFTYQPDGLPEYYVLLDRIDKSNFEYVSTEFGLQITNEIKSYDASHNGITANGFGLLQVGVDENNLYAKAEVKTLGRRVSTFSLSRITEPLYRRFDDPSLEGGEPGDVAKTLKFHELIRPDEYLYEDRMSSYSYVPGYVNKINFLGSESEATKDKLLADDPLVHAVLKTHNYAIYVDTAYVNRGTGWIKPQYLLLLDPQKFTAVTGCNSCNKIDPETYPITEVGTAVYGRYLVNATDSARPTGTSFGSNLDLPVKANGGANYISPFGNWERLVFVPAIHIADTLFILRGLTSEQGNPSIDKYLLEDGRLDYDALNRDYGGSIETKKTDLGNNLHKDYVFQFRYVERQIGSDGLPTNAGKHFMIESETTDRDDKYGRMIAPMNGGWVKIRNEVPVISRGAFSSFIREAEIFDVEPTSDAPLASETVDATKVTVLSGTGSVSILNASGKSVVISNVLGQIVANTVLTSDNATLSAPRGVVVVAVEGEDAVKAIVK